MTLNHKSAGSSPARATTKHLFTFTLDNYDSFCLEYFDLLEENERFKSEITKLNNIIISLRSKEVRKEREVEILRHKIEELVDRLSRRTSYYIKKY